MKSSLFTLLFVTLFIPGYNQSSSAPGAQRQKEITALIDQYSKARELRDTVLLKSILTPDIDQLVSTGEWREGLQSAVEGMQRSSANTPGIRTLSVYKLQMLNPTSAIVDCRYEIQNTDGTLRKMWSTFIVVKMKAQWRIRSIRNMLPAANN